MTGQGLLGYPNRFHWLSFVSCVAATSRLVLRKSPPGRTSAGLETKPEICYNLNSYKRFIYKG
jgi:hypothetical protein